MSDFNKYIDQYDFSHFIKFFETEGKVKTYAPSDYFCQKGEDCAYLGFITKGAFQYTVINDKGDTHHLGFAFDHSFVGHYASFRLQKTAPTDIQAIGQSELYVINREQLNTFYNQLQNKDVISLVPTLLFNELYERHIDLYTKTAQERYLELLHSYPQILNLSSLKSLASYLNIRPETLSRIRAKIST